MHRKEFDIQARRLTRSQDKFVANVHMMVEGVDHLTATLKSFREYIDAVREVMDSHADASKALIAAHESVLKAFAESSVTINENSARMERLIAKVDSYFGSGTGLDYDN